VYKPNEETLDIKALKGLKYNIGDVVYLRSDINFVVPMTIVGYSVSESNDYVLRWLNSQKKLDQNGFPEVALNIKSEDPR